MHCELSLRTSGLVKALLVVEPISLLLPLSLEPWLGGVEFELDGKLYIDSIFTASELLTSGRELLPPNPVGV